ncbi:TPA: type II toxin-antitoxin system PrlF family antitoxin [Pseudomonas aeruginosa]|uniref:type II toxin-antitoxin system PrlF family antitoxin n=1 Tax=Pseudomonas aeruginosa TaxID=287 RepID=UPI000D69B315
MPRKRDPTTSGSFDSRPVFLELLAKDMREQPSRLKPIDEKLVIRARELTARVAVDLDQPLSTE